MIKWFNSLKLATRIVALTLAVVIGVVAVNYVVFVRGYRESAVQAMVEKAKAFSAVADEAKNHTSLLHRQGSFDEKTLAIELAEALKQGRRVDETRVFATIPVVAGWSAAQDAARRENIEFRITAFDARNKSREPKAGSIEEKLMRDLTTQVNAGKDETIYAIDAGKLHFLRAIRLTENCLSCHGDPGSKYDVNKTGKDITGHTMEGWKVGQVHGSYHVVMSLAPISHQARAFLVSGLAWTVPLVAIALGLFVYLIGVLIRKPVTALNDCTSAIARGDLTREVPAALLARRDEVGDLARSLRDLSSALHSSLLEVLNSTGTLGVMSEELNGTSRRLTTSAQGTSERASTVAAAAEESSANTVSVAASMEQATTNLASVASATEEMSATVAEIAANSEKARAIGDQARQQAQTITSLMHELGQAAQAIGKVTETITDISSQTNLLALNATIEAARAGAAGKGFAVVANEIKELARQTAAATEDIKAKIAGVQNSTGSAMSDIEKITTVIQEVGHIIASIAAAIEEQATVTKDVAANIAQASAGVQEANHRVSQTASVSKSIAQDVAAVSEQGRAINNDSLHLQEDAEMLRGVTEQLGQLAARFELGQRNDFGAMKRAHLQWRSRLIEMFEGRQTISASDISDHHGCTLGKWYNHEGSQQFGHLAAFQRLGVDHEQFHALVVEIVQLWNAGKRPEAQQRFAQLIPHTTELFGLLDQITLEAGRSSAGNGSRSTVAPHIHDNSPPAGNGNGHGRAVTLRRSGRRERDTVLHS